MTTKQFFESHNTIKHLAKYVPDGIKHDYIICAMEHPNQTNCFHANASRWVRSLPGIFKLYGALNVLMMLFNLKRAARDPAGTALHLLKATSRSTLFFSLVVCACFNVLCASRRTIGYDAFPAFLLNGLIAGSYIFIEPSSRRTELGMYMLLRAIESQWDLGIKKGWWRAVKGGQLVYSALSVGVLMSLYQHDPSSIRSGYLSVMTRLFGHN
ncbi:hypothetical protein GQ42DRAFT_118297 [Ramicandelaber brevisporus]|nr:hypothetical protein GQ42DRAFT_118297 [Ramicandelaber brevisporus]